MVTDGEPNYQMTSIDADNYKMNFNGRSGTEPQADVDWSNVHPSFAGHIILRLHWQYYILMENW